MAEKTHPFYDMHTHGMVRVATATPRHRTGDVAYNVEGILAEAKKAAAQNVDLVVYPELCISSYAIDDLLLQNALLDASEAAIGTIAEATADLSPVLVVGAGRGELGLVAFVDVAASIAAHMGLSQTGPGQSFLPSA